MRSAMPLIVFVFLMLLPDSTSLAQRLANTLRGTVRLTASSPMAVRIQLQKFGVTIQEMFLRESSFEFRNVEEGRYTLVAAAPGYETVMEEIDVPGDRPVIELRPSRKAAQPPTEVPVWALRIPESARRHFEAAKSKLRQNNCVDALDHLRKAIRAYAEYSDAHTAMGQCYAQMTQFEAAEQEFKRALEQPHRPVLHLQLGNIYFRLGKHELIERQLDLYAEETLNAQRSPK
jgi:tetratricopeptide (TPR) repeat protein